MTDAQKIQSLVAEVELVRAASKLIQECNHALAKERDQLRTQLAPAEQTGYERGVRDTEKEVKTQIAATKKCCSENGISAIECAEVLIYPAILNLLNKKGTE